MLAGYQTRGDVSRYIEGENGSRVESNRVVESSVGYR